MGWPMGHLIQQLCKAGDQCLLVQFFARIVGNGEAGAVFQFPCFVAEVFPQTVQQGVQGTQFPGQFLQRGDEGGSVTFQNSLADSKPSAA